MTEQKLEAKYGLFTAIAMVIGQVIGSGIFFKVDDVLSATQGNNFAGLLGFLIVGISVVFAAVSMVEAQGFLLAMARSQAIPALLLRLRNLFVPQRRIRAILIPKFAIPASLMAAGGLPVLMKFQM